MILQCTVLDLNEHHIDEMKLRVCLAAHFALYLCNFVTKVRISHCLTQRKTTISNGVIYGMSVACRFQLASRPLDWLPRQNSRAKYVRCSLSIEFKRQSNRSRRDTGQIASPPGNVPSQSTVGSRYDSSIQYSLRHSATTKTT